MDQEQLKRAMQKAQNLQLELVKLQQALAAEDIEGSSENGLVNVTMNAEGQYKTLKINPAILKMTHNTLEESVLQAFGAANQKAAEINREKLLIITQEIGL